MGQVKTYTCHIHYISMVRMVESFNVTEFTSELVVSSKTTGPIIRIASVLVWMAFCHDTVIPRAIYTCIWLGSA